MRTPPSHVPPPRALLNPQHTTTTLPPTAAATATYAAAGPMPWQWKLCCAILYMLPWVDVTEKTVYFIERFPAFHWTEYFTGGRAARGLRTHGRDARG